MIVSRQQLQDDALTLAIWFGAVSKRLPTIPLSACERSSLGIFFRDVAGRIREAEDKILTLAANWEPEAVSPCFDLDKICE